MAETEYTPEIDYPEYKPGPLSKYKKKYCKINYDMLCNGDTINTVCAKIGIHKDTYYEWCKVNEAFSDSHKRGMAVGNAYWDKATKDHILSKISLTIDATYIMKMRNVYGHMTKDPDSSKEDTKEFMRELAAIRSGGKVEPKDWDKQFSKKTNG